jgi:hypothetical protein
VPQATFGNFIPGSLFTRLLHLPVVWSFNAYQASCSPGLFESSFLVVLRAWNPPSDFSGLPHQQIHNARMIVCCFSIGTRSIADEAFNVNTFYDDFRPRRDLLSSMFSKEYY